ncbi:MAG: PP2C family protein-serine/threonine phosphatase, partial [Verrucomicrobiota bacterium]
AARQRIEQEMMLAREIQASMLPTTIPELEEYALIGGSKAAYEVGGDYFDYLPSDDNGCFFLIADVSGKGVPAAMIMSIVRSLFHTYLEFEEDPGTILTRLNRSLSKDIETETFVTMTAIKLEADDHRIRIARAGHEPVMILKANGKIEHHSPPGPAVGLLDIESFEQIVTEETYDLEPDDTVILYTDGITEALNPEQEEFGLERLEEVVKSNRHLSVKGLYKEIIDQTIVFRNGMSQSDDCTLIIFRRHGKNAAREKTMKIQPVKAEVS